MPIDAKLIQTMAASAKLHVQELEDHGKAAAAGAVADAKHIIGHAKEAISDLTSAVLHANSEAAKDAKPNEGKDDKEGVDKPPRPLPSPAPGPVMPPVADAPKAKRAWLVPAIIAGALALAAAASYVLPHVR